MGRHCRRPNLWIEYRVSNKGSGTSSAKYRDLSTPILRGISRARPAVLTDEEREMYCGFTRTRQQLGPDGVRERGILPRLVRRGYELNAADANHPPGVNARGVNAANNARGVNAANNARGVNAANNARGVNAANNARGVNAAAPGAIQGPSSSSSRRRQTSRQTPRPRLSSGSTASPPPPRRTGTPVYWQQEEMDAAALRTDPRSSATNPRRQQKVIDADLTRDADLDSMNQMEASSLRRGTIDTLERNALDTWDVAVTRRRHSDCFASKHVKLRCLLVRLRELLSAATPRLGTFELLGWSQYDDVLNMLHEGACANNGGIPEPYLAPLLRGSDHDYVMMLVYAPSNTVRCRVAGVAIVEVTEQWPMQVSKRKKEYFPWVDPESFPTGLPDNHGIADRFVTFHLICSACGMGVETLEVLQGNIYRLFDDKARGARVLVSLRAISPVYAYYACKQGFRRLDLQGRAYPIYQFDKAAFDRWDTLMREHIATSEHKDALDKVKTVSRTKVVYLVYSLTTSPRPWAFLQQAWNETLSHRKPGKSLYNFVYNRDGDAHGYGFTKVITS